jgi:sigma54-dependent transcription regulator
MVSLNCGAMPETLLESELFGHMRGAFTGADQNKKGLLEVAEKGTIFLDEIGEMSRSCRSSCCGSCRSAGSPRGRARGTAGRHPRHRRNEPGSDEGGCRGRFREDLFYRINVIPIVLPPLRTAARTSRCWPSTS